MCFLARHSCAECFGSVRQNTLEDRPRYLEWEHQRLPWFNEEEKWTSGSYSSLADSASKLE